MKPSDISALGLPIPSKLKDLAARGGSFPLKGKYGLVSLSDNSDSDEKVLVGPNYFAEARLSAEKEINSDSDFDNEQTEGDDFDGDETESSRQPDSDNEKEEPKESFDKNPNADRQVEPFDNSENPFGFEYGKNPVFPPTYESIYNYLPNPYLPPFNFNIPPPLLNQYLQRTAYNPGLRYRSQFQYPGAYGQNQYSGNSPSFNPFTRYFYVQ